MVKIVASGSQSSTDITQPDKMVKLKKLQQNTTDTQAASVLEKIKSGDIPFINGIQLDEVRFQDMFIT